MATRSFLTPLALTFDEVVAMGEEGCDVVVLQLNDDQLLRPVGFGRLSEFKPRRNTIRPVRTHLSYQCVRKDYESSALVSPHDAERMGLLPFDPYLWERMNKEDLVLNGVLGDSSVYWSDCCVVRRSDAPRACVCSVEALEFMLSEIDREHPAY